MRKNKAMRIYLTTCTINGKIYVGQTTRRRSRYIGSGRLFLKAVEKHGKENFVCETIKDCTGMSQAALDFWETYYIKLYDSTNPSIGYNLLAFGGGSPMKDPVVAAKVGKANANNKAFLNKTHTEETKAVIRKKLKGRIPWNKGKPAPHKGFKPTQATKDKISNSLKGHVPWNKKS